MPEGKDCREIEVLCVGGAVVDRTYLAHRAFRPGTSNPASGSRSFGGVARNVAANLARLGIASGLVSTVGDDLEGRSLTDDLAGIGVDTGGLRRCPAARTAEYLALLEPDGSLALGVADMAILDELSAADLDRAPHAPWIFADCNCPAALLEALIAWGDARRLAIDAVSTPKVERLPARLAGVDLLFLNLDEAAVLLDRKASGLDLAEAAGAIRQRGVSAVVLTLGAEGLVFAADGGAPVHVPARPTEIVDVTGAGDALIAGTLAGLARGRALPDAVRLGMEAAALTLAEAGSTSPRLSSIDLSGARDRRAPLW